jgi:hypothetical protein
MTICSKLIAMLAACLPLLGCGEDSSNRYEIFINNRSDCASYLLDKKSGDVILLCGEKKVRVTWAAGQPKE